MFQSANRCKHGGWKTATETALHRIYLLNVLLNGSNDFFQEMESKVKN